jgi:hypothetical protein
MITLVGVLGTIPTLTLAYLTAPFTHQIFISLPQHAQRSLPSLLTFARSLASPHPHTITATANTRLEFVTLRIFPFRKYTTALLHELRALPPKRMRVANIGIAKTEDEIRRERAKGWGRRVLSVLNEPRWKFYVKEGRAYTARTGMPGVWEEVAKRIQEQSNLAEETGKSQKSRLGAAKKPVLDGVRSVVKRQTARGVKE